MKLIQIIRKIFTLIIAVIQFTVFILINTPTLNCQPNTKQERDRSFYYFYGEKGYTEAHILPTLHQDSIDLLIMFRISNDALAFTQNKLLNHFIAYPNLEIVIKDADGIIRKRSIWLDTVIVFNYDKTTSKTEFTRAFQVFRMPAGKYNVGINYSENNNLFGKKISIDTDSLSEFQAKEIISKPLFVYSPFDSSEVFVPYLLGGCIGFTQEVPKAILRMSYKKGKEYNFSYIIEKLPSPKTELAWKGDINLTGKPVLLENTFLKAFRNNSEKTIFINFESMTQIPQSKLSQGLLLINFPKSKFSPGKYRMKVCATGLDTSTFDFEVKWEDLPISLRNVDYAIDMMYYVLSDDEYEEMKSGSPKEKFSKLLDWWAKQDPTNTTPFNEAMSEYFKRVDYAYFNYQTLSEKDGAKSDRGKIYVLKGPPDKIDRRLEENASFEIWSYSRLNKEYVFKSVSAGVIRLAEIKDLK
ncbi:MAG: hypothetical protein HW421_1671 [Ignavibacteria bacterium]|nr:hypothetical protein [Ignavibacteria bacterium]